MKTLVKQNTLYGTSHSFVVDETFSEETINSFILDGYELIDGEVATRFKDWIKLERDLLNSTFMIVVLSKPSIGFTSVLLKMLSEKDGNLQLLSLTLSNLVEYYQLTEEERIELNEILYSNGFEKL